jgi:hypothetical protein
VTAQRLTLEERAEAVDYAIGGCLERAFLKRGTRAELPTTAKEAEKRGGDIRGIILAALRAVQSEATEAALDQASKAYEDLIFERSGMTPAFLAPREVYDAMYAAIRAGEGAEDE